MLKRFANFTAGQKVLVIAGGLFTLSTGFAVMSPSTQPASVAPEKISQPLIETKETTETEVIPFGSEARNDATLASGTTRTVQEGADGEKIITHVVTYENDVEKSRVKKSEAITRQPVNRIIANGTYVAPPPAQKPAPRSNCDPNYTPCVPIVAYDLDCPDIGHSVRVIGSDVHRFDREGDGLGCESY